MIYQESNYTIALLLSTNKKTCESLAKVVQVNGDKMLRELEKSGGTREEFIQLSKTILRKNKKVYLILDDTLIEKIYSLYIQGTSDNFDSSNRQTYRSLCTIVAMLTDGKFAIPIDHLFWVNKEFAQEHYKTKTELAIELISNITAVTKIDCVIMDGLYATIEMIRFLKGKNIYFEMRFHSNRKIKTEDGKTVLIKDLFRELMKGKRKKLCGSLGYWHEQFLYFTGVRRFKKNGDSIIVFQISNFQAAPREHERIYSFRWLIERFFRTAKQRLGLLDCQSRKRTAQDNHIRYIFKAYYFLQLERKIKKLKNVEKAHDRLKQKNYKVLTSYMASTVQIFGEIND